MPESVPPLELLRLYLESGVDEAIAEAPVDRFAPLPAPVEAKRPAAPAAAAPRPAPAVAPAIARIDFARADSGAASARAAAAAATDLAQLEEAIRGFDGCALKRTATSTVFADGNPFAPVMLIGEAPGAEEDRIGKPFVGRSGQLLDRMLAAVGLDRARNACITNVIYWRPPGNRTPTDAEVATCLPFVLRHIALARPKIVVLCGGRATSAVLGRKEGITKLRGHWFELEVPDLDGKIPTLPTYHPSYLLRSPLHKREAWRDLLTLQSKLEKLS